MKLRLFKSALAAVYMVGLQAWHRFSATAWSGANRLPDSSTAGTNTAALHTGLALSFDGVNDVVNVGATGATVRTVVFWANPATTTQSLMQLQASGAVRIQIASGTLSATGFTSPTLYVNGTAGSTVAASAWQMLAVTTATGLAASNVLFGQQASTFYQGLMASVRFFSTQLNATQVAELYANPEQAIPTGSVAADLVGYWGLNEPAGTVALNAVALGKTGNISGATPTTAITGALPQWSISRANTVKRFDGTNDVVDFGDVLDIGTSDYTYAAWVCVDNASADYYAIGKYSTASGGGMALFAANGQYRAQFSDGTTTVTTGILTNNSQRYVFAAAVADRDGLLTCYVNGVAEASASIASMSAANVQNSTTFKIGNSFSFVNRFFNGFISWAAAWNKVLTASELVALYNSGVPMAPTANSGNYASAANLQGYWLNRGNNLTDWADLSGNGRNAVTIGGSPAQVIAIPSVNSRDAFQLPLPSASTNLPLVLLGNGHAQMADAASLDLSTALTIEAWVLPYTVAAAQTIVGKNNAYSFNITSGAKLQLTRWASASSASAADTTNIAVNVWTHVAVVWNGSTATFYTNGTARTSPALTGTIDNSSTAVLIGALAAGSQQFNGRIDSVKIYNVALTAAQVAGNYAAEVSTHQ